MAGKKIKKLRGYQLRIKKTWFCKALSSGSECVGDVGG